MSTPPRSVDRAPPTEAHETMAANLKDIKSRIDSVKKTRQITQAMKLVAGAKLKRATDAATNARPYQQQLAQVLGRVAARAGDVEDPLLTTRDEVRRAKVVVLTTDKGLCGGFNNNLLRRALGWLHEKRAEGAELDLRVYGRRGVAFFAPRGFHPGSTVVEWSAQPKMDLVRDLADDLVSGFLTGEHDEVWLVYNEFKSALTQTPRFFKLLPLSVERAEEAEAALAAGPEYRYEPAAPEILGALLPLYIRTLILQAFLETEAGEFASRMTAMDAATRNASDLIDNLTLDYNRARQAAITTELIEIVSGANAL